VEHNPIAGWEPLRPADAATVVEARQLTKRFGQRSAVDSLVFTVPAGAIFGLIGPSGCGKTTTIRTLTGVYRPTSGEARVFGRDPSRFGRAEREAIGYLPQHFVLYPELSVASNLAFVAGLHGVVRRRARRIAEVLDFVELADSRDKPASKLSGGMQRRLGLAAALLHQPVLLFVDEPTAGIDPVLRAKFWDGFRALREQGCTIFLTTQYVTEAEYCDQVAVLRDGRLIALGPPPQIRQDAVGGEALELEADGLDRASLAEVAQLPGIRRSTLVSYGLAHLIVDDAPVVVPRLKAAIHRLGLGLRRLESRQPTFDEVFVLLMEADGPAGRGVAEERAA
jgi:ABC-2 type transport system ATP-binding protein